MTTSSRFLISASILSSGGTPKEGGSNSTLSASRKERQPFLCRYRRVSAIDPVAKRVTVVVEMLNRATNVELALDEVVRVGL